MNWERVALIICLVVIFGPALYKAYKRATRDGWDKLHAKRRYSTESIKELWP
jgi:hypothetical protein